MNPIDVQGSVPITGGIMYTPAHNLRAEISNIKINNSVSGSYTIIVEKYSVLTTTKIRLYAFSLADGEMVDDYTPYQLQEGDYLYLIPSVPTVVFVINGLEYSI